MRIFYDCEFLEDGRTIDLISIGLVTETDDTFYAVNDELLDTLKPGQSLYRRICEQSPPWLIDNVVPHLPLRAHRGTGKPDIQQRSTSISSIGFHLDPEDPAVLPARLIRRGVRDFVLGQDEPELWAWYGAYDHVALCQLFGRMIELPEGFPMWTNDIRTLAMLAGPQAREGAPKQESAVHHALNDAKHDRDLYDYYAPLVDVWRLA